MYDIQNKKGNGCFAYHRYFLKLILGYKVLYISYNYN